MQLRFAFFASIVAFAIDSEAQNKPVTHASAARSKPSYSSYVHRWHAPEEGRVLPVDSNGRKMLVLYALNTNERIELPALSDHGGFAAHDLDRAAHILRDPGRANEHPVEPRVLDAVYQIELKFDAQEIRIISGYRTARPGGGSNHGKGRAIDLVVPGASDEDVAKFARDMGFMGVGVYSASGFVHVDVRDRSYFWVDSSGPGRRNRERGIHGDVALAADAAAVARGDHGLPPLVVQNDVERALGPQSLLATPSVSADEDDDDWTP